MPTFSLSAGFNSLVNRISLILQCISDCPVAKMSKGVHFNPGLFGSYDQQWERNDCFSSAF